MKAGVRQREAMVNISVQVMGGTRKLLLEVAEDITVSECMTWCVASGRALLLTPHQADPSGWAAPGRRAAPPQPCAQHVVAALSALICPAAPAGFLVVSFQACAGLPGLSCAVAAPGSRTLSTNVGLWTAACGSSLVR